MLRFLEAGHFNDCGAAVGESAAAVICEAALKAAEKRQHVQAIQNNASEGGLDATNEAHHTELSMVPPADSDDLH